MTTPYDKIDADVTGRNKEPTEEMVRAGVREYLSYDGRFEEDYDAVVVRIWKAMKAASIKI